MTNHELGEKLGAAIRQERKITNEILGLISLALERRAYLELGYPSMIEWLVKGFGYSGSAAYRRVEAAKLLRAVPDVAKKLENGAVNLSTVAKAQTVIRAQERIQGKKVSPETKHEVMKQIEGLTVEQSEKTLFGLFPDTASVISQEKRTVIDQNTIRHSMNLPANVESDLQRAKEVLSHIFPRGTDAEVIGYALKFLLNKKDPLRQHPGKSVTQRSTASVLPDVRGVQ